MVSALAEADQNYDLEEATDDESIVSLFDQRWSMALAEASDYQYEAAIAWDYYANAMSQEINEEDPDIEPFVANVIRRDLDQMTSRVIDAELVVHPKGRFESGYSTGELLVDLLQYTRDEETDWLNDQEDAIQDCFHTGEGIVMEQWDQSAAKGLGMPRCDWVDPRYFLWDTAARKWHRQDAAWMLYFPPYPVHQLKRKWDLDHVDADFPGRLGEALDQERSGEYGDRPSWLHKVVERQGQSAQPMAFERHMWERKDVYRTVYINPDTREIATVTDADGSVREMTREDYRRLGDDEKSQYVKDRSKTEELWHTILVNDYVVRREISIYDKSNGGHGMFPFAFFSYVRVRNRTHAKGEVSYLIQLQNLTNRILARWLEQLVVASTQYMVAEQGSLTIEDEEKIMNGTADPVQLLRTHPGFQPPQVVGGNATGADVLNAGFNFLSSIRDKVSGVYDVHRGQMPYQTSGRGIRALQSEADLLGVMPRRHIESGLRQATILRLSNILQFMSAERMVEVADRSSKEPRPLYIGRSMRSIQAQFNLKPMTKDGIELLDLEGVPIAFEDPHRVGEAADVLVIGPGNHDVIDWARIELELDTNKERNREERMQFAETYLDKLGPVAAMWSLELQDAPNKDMLINAIDDANRDKQTRAAIEKAAQAIGMEPDQLLQQFLGQVQQVAQAQQAQQGQGGAGG